MGEKQPLNEAYQNDVLVAFQKISDIFDDFSHLMEMRVPYEEWPEQCKIAGLSSDLLGLDFVEQISNHSANCVKDLEESIKEGWKNVQPSCRPDESFRAMLRVMIRWMAYMESQKENLEPTKDFQLQAIYRLEDIGRAQIKLKSILDDDIFDNLSKHDLYWKSEHDLEDEKLDDIRRKISCLNDNLWDLWAILKKESE